MSGRLQGDGAFDIRATGGEHVVAERALHALCTGGVAIVAHEQRFGTFDLLVDELEWPDKTEPESTG